VVIGLILAGVAIVLATETRHLLIGESAKSSVQEAVRQIAVQDEAVTDVVRLLTMHLGPEDLLVNLDVRFRRDLDVAGVSAASRNESRASTPRYATSSSRRPR
jgi:divalent metal cation (Fe/Co/Zn/Cd) transporter